MGKFPGSVILTSYHIQSANKFYIIPPLFRLTHTQKNPVKHKGNIPRSKEEIDINVTDMIYVHFKIYSKQTGGDVFTLVCDTYIHKKC